MTNLLPAQISTERSVYVAAIVLSLALSAWSAYAQQIPNPDALYYLRAAELFHAGQWQQGMAVYRWPFFSLAVAGMMFLTGVTAPVAAQVVNALFDCATAVIFIALVRQLAADVSIRSIAGWAAFIIVLHPKLAVLRAAVVRDHGYYAFVLLTLYLVVRDHQHPRSWIKPAIVCSIVVAALFRLEALLLALVVPAFYLVADTSAARRRLLAVPAVALAGLLLAVVYAVWSGTLMLPGAPPSGLDVDVPGRFREIAEALRARAARLSEAVPPIRNAGTIAYIGFSVAALVDALLRAVTIPIAILAIFAFAPRRLLSDFATRFVLWFAAWQVALLFAFMVLAFFLDWRFAMVFALIMTIPAVFTLAEIAALWRARMPAYRVLFPIALLAVIVPWILDVPRFSKLEHLRDAGLWISRNLPSNATVLTNDGRIAYFSGRALHRQITLNTSATRADRTVSEFDYVAVESARNAPPPFVTRDLQERMIATIDGLNNRSVYIYKTK
jgi:hypothetical protein